MELLCLKLRDEPGTKTSYIACIKCLCILYNIDNTTNDKTFYTSLIKRHVHDRLVCSTAKGMTRIGKKLKDFFEQFSGDV